MTSPAGGTWATLDALERKLKKLGCVGFLMLRHLTYNLLAMPVSSNSDNTLVEVFLEFSGPIKRHVWYIINKTWS